MKKLSSLVCVLLVSLGLNACGGGGGSSTVVSPPPVLATAAYEGTWKNIVDSCERSDVRLANATGANLNEDIYATFTPLTNTTVSVVITSKLYAPTDTSCSGSVVSTRVQSPFTFSTNGTSTFNGQVFDKIQFGTELVSTTSLVVGSFTATNSSLGNSAMTINGYYFPTGYFTPQNETGEKAYLRVSSPYMYCDNGTGSMAAYPTGVDAAACFFKI